MAVCSRQCRAARSRRRHPCPRESIARPGARPARGAARREYRRYLSGRRHASKPDNEEPRALKAAAAAGARQVFRAFDADPIRLAEIRREIGPWRAPTTFFRATCTCRTSHFCTARSFCGTHPTNPMRDAANQPVCAIETDVVALQYAVRDRSFVPEIRFEELPGKCVSCWSNSMMPWNLPRSQVASHCHFPLRSQRFPRAPERKQAGSTTR